MLITRRKNIRLTGYDYATEGGYFITLVTRDRAPLFGSVIDGEMVLNQYGQIVAEEWERSGEIRAEIELDEYIVMPNHFHAILNIIQPGRGDRPVAPTEFSSFPAVESPPIAITLAQTSGPRSRSLGALIAGFKSAVTTHINTLRGTPGAAIWQRNYYDHIIRSDHEYEDITTYIANNPANWLTDAERLA